MGIFDRLGRVIRTYLEDEEGRIFSRPRRADPDMEAAEAEVESFLRREGRGKGGGNQSGGFRGGGSGTPGREGALEKLRGDFAELGLPLGAGPEECKAAYKRLLKLHHPDRHAGHEGNSRRATEKSARINAAYDRIEKWRREAGKAL